MAQCVTFSIYFLFILCGISSFSPYYILLHNKTTYTWTLFIKEIWTQTRCSLMYDWSWGSIRAHPFRSIVIFNATLNNIMEVSEIVVFKTGVRCLFTKPVKVTDPDYRSPPLWPLGCAMTNVETSFFVVNQNFLHYLDSFSQMQQFHDTKVQWLFIISMYTYVYCEGRCRCTYIMECPMCI
jgi:hypothetical protein